MFELIQNADDCEYTKGKATFTLSIQNGQVLASYNEKGFAVTNVNSICGAAMSSKKGQSNKIGLMKK